MLPVIAKSPRVFILTQLVCCGFVQVGSVIGIALSIRELIDQLKQPSVENSAFEVLLVGLFVFAVVGALSRWFDRYASEKLGQSYSHELRLSLYDHLPHAKKVGAGVSALHFVTDLNAIKRWVSQGLSRLIVSGISLVGILGLLTYFDSGVGAIAFFVLLLSTWLTIFLGSNLKQSIQQTRKNRGKLANDVTEKAANITGLLVFGRFKKERKRLAELSERLARSMIRQAFWIGSVRGLSELTARCLLVLVIGLGVSSVAQSQYDLGTLVAMVGVIGIMATPIRDLARVFEYWKSAQVARHKIQSTYEVTALTVAPQQPSRTDRSRVGFQRASIGNISKTFSAKVPPRSKIVIVGRNGSGKSTLLQHIAGISVPKEGRIQINRVDAHALTSKARRELIGFANNELPLISGSLGKNIRYRLPGASEEEVAQACERANLAEFVAQLPDDLDTRISTKAIQFSEGEIARIKLSRAIIGEPALLLLDEIDASMDDANIHKLCDLIKSYTGTVFFVTHNTQLMAVADQIWRCASDQIHVSSSAGAVLKFTHEERAK